MNGLTIHTERLFCLVCEVKFFYSKTLLFFNLILVKSSLKSYDIIIKIYDFFCDNLYRYHLHPTNFENKKLKYVKPIRVAYSTVYLRPWSTVEKHTTMDI